MITPHDLEFISHDQSCCEVWQIIETMESISTDKKDTGLGFPVPFQIS